MVLRIILLTLLLILLILLFAPLCVRLAFDDGDFRWSARYLFLRKSSVRRSMHSIRRNIRSIKKSLPR